MDSFTAVYDACVLYPAPIRDVLLELADAGIFRARWTAEIQEEWVRNLLERRKDLRREQLEYTCRQMNEAIPDGLVTGYEGLIGGLALPDPDDRHVLAAAIVAKAGVIVTFNLKDFPEEVLEPYGVEAQHPDDFLVYQFDLAPGAVCAAVKGIRARLKNPPRSVEEYLGRLVAQGLPQFVERLRRFGELL